MSREQIRESIVQIIAMELREVGSDTVTLPDVLAHNEHEGWYLSDGGHTHFTDEEMEAIYRSACALAEGILL